MQKLYNFVDDAKTVKFDSKGTAHVKLAPPYGVVSVTKFRKAHVQIGSTSATKFRLFFGHPKLMSAIQRNVDSKIHSFEITGPKMALTLHGPKNKTEKVELWVYVTD